MIRLFILVFLVAHSFIGYSQLTDDFSDGNFTNNPTWTGLVRNFGVNDSYKLQLMATDMGESYLVTPSRAIENATWEFLAFLDFATSGANYAKIYLVSDTSDLTSSLNGYFVLIGKSSDNISLYRQDGESEVALIEDTAKIKGVNPVNVRIKVTRDADGNWELSHDVTGGSTYVSVGTAQDEIHLVSYFFGVDCIYTSTRSTKFFFDDFSITGATVTDTTPPAVELVSVLSQSEIDIKFDEDLDQITAENVANYALNLGASVANAMQDVADASLIHLTISGLVNGQKYTLSVSNVEDKSGNMIAGSIDEEIIYLMLTRANFRDVQINEFMADPTPSWSLPAVDFVELYNPTSNYYDLENWQIGDGIGQSGQMKSFILAPDSYIIICGESDAKNFEVFGDVIGLPSFPNFNSSSDDVVILLNDSGLAIDRVKYSANDVKDGTTLEQVNPELVCSGLFNFMSSLDDSGGTPGRINSVHRIVPDSFGPNLTMVSALSSDSLRLEFDEVVNPLTLQIGDVSFRPSLAISAVNVRIDYPKNVFVELTDPIQPNVSIQITVRDISDCAGNSIGQGTLSFFLGLKPEEDDILLSEILFNPRSNGADFVEIYNPSATDHFELRGWKLARLKNGIIEDEEEIASNGLLLAPSQFFVFSNDINDLMIQYPAGNSEVYVELSKLPIFGNAKGTVVLVNDEGVIVQRLDYQEGFHYELLKDIDGVSLERVSYSHEVNNPNNWRSAASTVGFATPGRVNSQSAEWSTRKGKLVIEPKIFLPGNSGSGRDFTTINYSFDLGGKFANVIIYDQSGRQVKQLANGVSLPVSGFFRWDGTTDRGAVARMGYHVVVFEVFDGNGNKSILKETVVVGRNF